MAEQGTPQTGTPQTDYAQQILQPLQIDDSVKADAWDAYNGASSLDDFTKRVSSLNIPDSAKADLWDKANERFSQGAATTTPPAATTAATTPPETNPQEPSMWSAITNSPAANYIKKKYGQLTEWGGGKGAELATQPVKALTAAENPNLAEAGLPMLSMNRIPEQNAMIRTDEQLTSLAQQKHPYAMGVATGVGKAMGGMAVDPLQWAMTLSGVEALPILHKVITGAFAAKAGYDTITGANQLAKDWDKLTPNERTERLTSLGLTGAMTVAAASHMTKGMEVPAPLKRLATEETGAAQQITPKGEASTTIGPSRKMQAAGLGRIAVEPHEPRAKTGEALGEIQRPANKPSVMGTAYTPVAPNVPSATGEPRFGGATNPTPKVTVAGTAYTPVEPKVTPTAEPKFGGGTNPAPTSKVNLAVPREVTARPFSSIGGPIDVNVPKAEAAKLITPAEVKSTPGTSMGPKVTVGGKEVPKTNATAEQIKAHEAGGGSTFDANGKNRAGEDTHSIGAYPDRTREVDNLTPEVLDKFKKDNEDLLKKPDHVVGTWKDPDTGKVVLDVSKLVQDRDEAVQAGKDANQKAIYNLKSGETINTGGTGKGTVADAADTVNKAMGKEKIDNTKSDLDPRREKIADAYEAMKHDPNDPKVKESYDALKKETVDQFKQLEKSGYKLEPSAEDPYKTYEEMKKDIDDNKRLKVWTGAEPPADHPMSEIEPESGLAYNTIFRFVHDIMGHAAGDNDFSEVGEENAWKRHSQSYSDKALPAMTTETKGQTSTFFNGEKVRKGGQPDFPEQKANLLPAEFTKTGDRILDQVKAEQPNEPASKQFAEASRRAEAEEKGIAGETNADDNDAVKQRIAELSNANLKKLGAALGLDPDAYNFQNRVVPEGRSQKVPVEREKMVGDVMAKLTPEQVEKVAEQGRAIKEEPKVAGEAARSFKSRAEEAEHLLNHLWAEAKPEAAATEPVPAAKAEEKPVAETKTASPKIETKFTGGDKQYEGKSNKGKAMKAYAAKKAAEAENETGKGIPEIKDNILDQLEKAPKDDNGKPTVIGKVSLSNAVGATAEETEQALRELQKEGKIDAHVGRQGGEPAETVYAAALKSAEAAKSTPEVTKTQPEAGQVSGGVEGGTTETKAPKIVAKGDQAHFDIKENGAENNRDAQAQIEAAARAAKEQGLTELHSANDPAWFYAWSKFGKDHGLTPIDHAGDGYAWDLKDFEPEKQFEGKRPGPEATAATAKMTPEEAQAAGFTKEQVETGVNLPRAGGGAEGEIPAKKLSGMSRIPEKILKQFTDEEIAGLKTPKSQQKAADVLKTLPKFQEWVDIANLGAGERKWYQRGTAAIQQIADLLPQWFDKTKGDVDRFLNLLAAYSPQQPIDRNFTEALGIWKELKTAEKNGVDLNSPAESPRPDKLRKDIEWTKAAELMWDNTSMYRGAKVPNAMMGWTGKTANEMWPDLTKNNAFKVPSFAANLAGFLRKVTNDGWMGAFSGISGDDLSDPQHYHPISVMARAAAEELGWEPAEAQAAVWAAVKTLTEEGTATPEGIRKYAQDFADLAQHDPQMRDMLSKMGIDLEALDDRLKSNAIPERPEVASRGTPSTEDSVRKLTDRLRKSGRKGIQDLSPEDQDRIRELSGKPKANQTPAEKALGKAMEDEGDTSFNPSELESGEHPNEVGTRSKMQKKFGKATK